MVTKAHARATSCARATRIGDTRVRVTHPARQRRCRARRPCHQALAPQGLISDRLAVSTRLPSRSSVQLKRRLAPTTQGPIMSGRLLPRSLCNLRPQDARVHCHSRVFNSRITGFRTRSVAALQISRDDASGGGESGCPEAAGKNLTELRRRPPRTIVFGDQRAERVAGSESKPNGDR